MRLLDKFARLPNFFLRFGAVDGLRLWVANRGGLVDPGTSAAPLRVKGYGGALWLRPSISDHAIFWQCIVRDQYDITKFPQFNEIKRRARVMREKNLQPVIIDGGANIGLASVWFAEQFPDAMIVSIEPDQDNMRVLKQNIERFGERVIPILAAVGSQNAHARVVGRDRGSSAFLTEPCEANHPDSIPYHDIPSLVAKVANGRPWIIKLDIEGAQSEVFSANTAWVGEADVIILELDDWLFPWSASSQTFFQALTRFRYDYMLHGEHIVCFRHLESAREDYD